MERWRDARRVGAGLLSRRPPVSGTRDEGHADGRVCVRYPGDPELVHVQSVRRQRQVTPAVRYHQMATLATHTGVPVTRRPIARAPRRGGRRWEAGLPGESRSSRPSHRPKRTTGRPPRSGTGSRGRAAAAPCSRGHEPLRGRGGRANRARPDRAAASCVPESRPCGARSRARSAHRRCSLIAPSTGGGSDAGARAAAASGTSGSILPARSNC